MLNWFMSLFSGPKPAGPPQVMLGSASCVISA